MGRYSHIIYDYNIVSAAFCAAVAIVVYIPVRAVWLGAQRRARKPLSAELALALLVGYGAALINIVWFPVPETLGLLFSDPAALADKFRGGYYARNFEVLRWLLVEHDPLALLRDFEIRANIALFVPLGFLLPIAFRRLGLRRTALICLGATCLVELVQPLFGRAGDLDDVITNALGGIIGCLPVTLFRRRRRIAYEKKGE